MIDQTNIDLTMSTVAVLIEASSQSTRVNQRELEGILNKPLTIGESPAGLVVSSQRDQTDVIAGGNKINVRDLSGLPRFSECKIPQVLDYFFNLFQAPIVSFGVNFLLTLKRTEPGQWIRDNMLSSQLADKLAKEILAGAVSIKLKAEPKICNIKLDPVDDKSIAIDFNAHEEATCLPGEARLRKELQEQYDALLRFLNDLGL